jgi:hypothetical protein
MGPGRYRWNALFQVGRLSTLVRFHRHRCFFRLQGKVCTENLVIISSYILRMFGLYRGLYRFRKVQMPLPMMNGEDRNLVIRWRNDCRDCRKTHRFAIVAVPWANCSRSLIAFRLRPGRVGAVDVALCLEHFIVGTRAGEMTVMTLVATLRVAKPRHVAREGSRMIQGSHLCTQRDLRCSSQRSQFVLAV